MGSYAPMCRLPPIAGLVVYTRPPPGRAYVLGADLAEGNPTSDDSAVCVLDTTTGEEVAALAGKVEPSVFAQHIATLSRWYNGAAVLCERNNHGHAVLLALRGVGGITLLSGHDGKEGWMSSTLGKTQLYDNCADAFKNKEVVVHSFSTFAQLASIDGNTLRAPEGEHDDKADAFALAVCARLALLGSADDAYEPVLGAPGKADLWLSGGFDGSFY